MNKIIPVFFTGALLLLLGVNGHAAVTVATADYAFERFVQQATGVGQQGFSVGGNGTVSGSPLPYKTTLDGGLIRLDGGARLLNPSGVPYTVSGSARLSGAGIGVALGKFFAKAVPIVSVGVAVYEVAQELGFIPATLPGGTVGWRRRDDSLGTPYYLADFVTPVNNTRYPSVAAACQGAVGSYNSNRLLTSLSTVSGGGCKFNGDSIGWLGPTYVVPDGTEIPTERVSSQQEFIDAVAARSGWPSTSRIVEALEDAGRVGIKTEVGPLIVTGPATSPGPISTKVNSDNTTTTTTTTYNHSYEGDKVTTTTNTVTNITNTKTGALISTDTATTSPPPKPEPLEIETCGLPGKPKCQIDETGTKPDAGTTLDSAKTALDTAKDSAKNAIDGASSMTAPTWSFSFQLPTGCAPYVTGLRGVILNVCEYQSKIHDLMSMIWAASTFFCLVGMVGRTIRES